MSVDHGSEATIDPVAVISLVRQLLSDADVGTPNLPHHENGANGRHYDCERSQEDAGCMLWDLSAISEAASIMAENHIFDILPFIIEHASDRLAEISTGILGNLACHNVLIPQLLAASLKQAILGHALWRDDPACLTEVLRLLGSLVSADGSQEWLQELLQSKVLERIVWIMDNTLNNSLFERACHLLTQAVSTSADAVSAVLQQPFINILCNSLQQSAQLTAGPETQGNEWDSPSRAVDDDAFPGTQAAQAAFDVLEAVAEDPGGAAALRQDELLIDSMLSLLQGIAILPLRGRAAALMAELSAEAIYRPFAQDAGAMEKLLSLVVLSSSDEDYGEACWALLAGVAHLMLTAEKRRQVLYEVAKKAEELAIAAIKHTEIEQGLAASHRVAYALRQLAALLEDCKSLPAQGHPPQAGCTSQIGSGPDCYDQPALEVQQEAGSGPPGNQEERHSQIQGDQQRIAGMETFQKATAILLGVAKQIMDMHIVNETTMPL